MAPRRANISNTSSRASSDVESHESLLTLAESRSGASQSIDNVKPQATKRRPAAGYEVCAHTCVKGGCYSPATKTLLWNKDGASARWHGTNPNLHMDFNEDCPAADMLAWNVRAGMAYPHRLGAVRPPTNEEMEAALLLDDSSKILDGMATFKNDVEVGAEFHLLFVPDPTTGASREIEAKADVGFATTTLSKEQFQKVEHLKHHIYPLKKVKEGVKALIQEWLYLCLTMDEWRDEENPSKRLHIHFMDWTIYRRALLYHTAETEMVEDWQFLKEVDCVIGGFDGDMPYLNKEYDLDTNNIGIFRKNLESLRRFTFMWPPFDQPHTMGSKWQLIENLDIVANKMRTARPRSILLNPDKPIPHQAVLKCTHSESSKHVLLLDNPNRNWDHLKNHSEIPGSRWFAQTYVPQLETAGEWRVLMVNGKSLYVVHTLPNTKKGTWQRELVYNYYSLKELTKLHIEGALATTNLCNPDSGTYDQREAAKDEFFKFVTDAFHELYCIESKVLGAKSSIALFCRMDISLIIVKDHKDDVGRVNYWVNEVERAHTTSLWTNRTGSSSVGQRAIVNTLSNTLAQTFHAWMSSVYQPHHT